MDRPGYILRYYIGNVGGGLRMETAEKMAKRRFGDVDCDNGSIRSQSCFVVSQILWICMGFGNDPERIFAWGNFIWNCIATGGPSND